MEKFKSLKKYLPIYMIMLSIVLLMGTSYALLRSSHQGENTYTMNVGTLQVIFVDSETNSLTLENAYPMTDDEGMSESKELVFTVKNTGTVTAKYSVYIEETSTSPEFKSVIRFISNKNDTGYNSPKTLSEDKYIDSESYLGVSEITVYKVKAWIAETADATYMDKTFTARIVVDATQYAATPTACFYYKDVTFYKYKENIDENEASACATFIKNYIGEMYYDDYGVEYGTAEDFCVGKIVDINNYTISDYFPYYGYKDTFSSSDTDQERAEILENFATKVEGIEITGYNEWAGEDDSDCPLDIVIPEQIENKPVISISSEMASFSLKNISSIILPNTLIEISKNAFSETKFKHIEFPNSLEVIGYEAFKDASLEGNLVISGGVRNVDSNAFDGNNITSVQISDNVVSILSSSFANNKIKKVEIGSGIKTIERGAFLKSETSNPELSIISVNRTCDDMKNLSFGPNKMMDYPWLAIDAPYTATGVTMYGSNNEVCDTF